MSVFLDRFGQIVQDQKWPKQMSPASLIRQWDSFVRDCETSYGMGWDEYRNDLQCRGFIEVVLKSPLVQGLPELPEFKQEVQKIDQRFRALFAPGIALPVRSDFWWELGVPRNVGDALRSDLKSLFSIEY